MLFDQMPESPKRTKLSKRERDALEHFKGDRKLQPAVVGPVTIANLVYKKWVERFYTEEANLYQTTEAGLKALDEDKLNSSE